MRGGGEAGDGALDELADDGADGAGGEGLVYYEEGDLCRVGADEEGCVAGEA